MNIDERVKKAIEDMNNMSDEEFMEIANRYIEHEPTNFKYKLSKFFNNLWRNSFIQLLVIDFAIISLASIIVFTMLKDYGCN